MGETYDPSLVTFPVEMITLVPTSLDTYSSSCTRSFNDDEVCAVCLDDFNSSNSPEDAMIPSSFKDSHDSYQLPCLGLNSNYKSVDGVTQRKDEDKEVRELIHSCHHVFHRGCIEAWVAGGHATCPACWAKLLPDSDHPAGFELPQSQRPANGDPWRLERMIYLLGEDNHVLMFLLPTLERDIEYMS